MNMTVLTEKIYRKLYKKVFGRIYGIIIKNLPMKVVGFFEAYFKPEFRNACEPLNGQQRRKELFHELMDKIQFNAIVETGTLRGNSTKYLAQQFKVPVYTVENFSRYYYCAYFRLSRIRNICCFQGDSREFLRKLGNNNAFPKKYVLFYLDAHWYRDLPLREELRIINEFWSESVIIIDDFKVPDDRGYNFDDYGEGEVLCLEYIKSNDKFDFEVFWPSARSSSETGCRCGSVVLATKDSIIKRIREINSLRQI